MALASSLPTLREEHGGIELLLRAGLMGWIHGLQAQKVGSSWGRGRVTPKKQFLSEKLLYI